MSEDLKYTSFNAFAKAGMIYMHKSLKDETFDDKQILKEILSLLKDLKENDFEKPVKTKKVSVIDDFREKLENTPTDTEYNFILNSVLNILSNEFPRWVDIEDIIHRIGIGNNNMAIGLFQNMIFENQEFKNLVERKHRMLRARDSALPHEKYLMKVSD